MRCGIEPSQSCSNHIGRISSVAARSALAESALHRVMPLAIQVNSGIGPSRTWPVSAAWTRDARPALVEAIKSVLGADTRCRNRLTCGAHQPTGTPLPQNLDFERASRVQAEIQGFEWVVSEQNVTLSEPHGFEVCGWSSGILVHFGYRRAAVHMDSAPVHTGRRPAISGCHTEPMAPVRRA